MSNVKDLPHSCISSYDKFALVTDFWLTMRINLQTWDIWMVNYCVYYSWWIANHCSNIPIFFFHLILHIHRRWRVGKVRLQVVKTWHTYFASIHYSLTLSFSILHLNCFFVFCFFFFYMQLIISATTWFPKQNSTSNC